jgi:hypothetical protein
MQFYNLIISKLTPIFKEKLKTKVRSNGFDVNGTCMSANDSQHKPSHFIASIWSNCHCLQVQKLIKKALRYIGAILKHLCALEIQNFCYGTY